MPIKTDLHIIKGMQKDISVSKANSEFAFDAMNIRLTAREGNTLLSVTNEKGNKEIPLYTAGNPTTIEGTIIGYNVLNNYLTLFTCDVVDRIYRLEYKDTYFEVLTLYNNSKLGFDTNNPIESLGVFENENIQKVYWIDGINQPRVINITASEEIINSWDIHSFDFVQELSLQESVIITRNDSSNGTFAPGVIQYAFSYYNKYGQESNIFYTSPLHYLSYSNRGSSPEDKVNNSFNITINNVDTRFEYIRIYSIHRTSIDATPTVLNVIDLPTNQKIRNSSVSYIDNGTSGTLVDPTELLYIGGEDIVAKAFTHKDNTLFLGNIELKRPSIPEDIKNNIVLSYSILKEHEKLNTSLRSITKNTSNKDAYYIYDNFLSEGNTAGFKSGENYRLGLQFQYKTGKWSEPIFIGDYIINDVVKPSIEYRDNESILKIPKIEYSVDKNIINSLKELGYKKVRPLVVFPNINDRRIVTQGMLCPTVFNLESRNNSTPFAQSSWFLRPFLPWDVNKNISSSDNNGSYIKEGAWVEFRHHYGIHSGATRGAEIQNISSILKSNYSLQEVNDLDKNPDVYMIDQSILTMHSPDIEFDSSLHNIDSSGLQLRIVGAINFTSSIGDINIQVSSPTIHPKATGFYHKTIGVAGDSKHAARSLVSGLFYRDWLVDDVGDKIEYYDKEPYEMAWMIYPWHKSGSLNNDINRSTGARSSVLKRKVISNLKFSKFNTWFKPSNYWYSLEDDSVHNGITKIQLFNSNEVSLTKIPLPENAFLNTMNYYGNVDTLLPSKGEYKQFLAGIDYTNDDGNISITGWYEPTFYSTKFASVDTLKDLGDSNDNIEYSQDPVRIKYKSSPHIVFSTNYTRVSSSQVILPTIIDGEGSAINKITETIKPFWVNRIGEVEDIKGFKIKFLSYEDVKDVVTSIVDWEEGDYYYDGYNNVMCQYDSSLGFDFPFVLVDWESIKGNYFYFDDQIIIHLYEVKYDGNYSLHEYGSISNKDLDFSIKQDVINEKINYPYLFLAELYREEDSLVNIFGGTTEEAFRNNLWIPAGDAISIDSNIVNFLYGDTWYQRYDCLKTYPFTLEDENSIVEIGSFMCETRVNIDGRYDRNRGQISNLNMTPNNFNLLNPVYSQKDNFFNYRILDKDYYKLNKFNNTITWTKEKQLGSNIDIWTNITMASTLDLDGDKGEISSLKTFNNEIFCFQKQGISNILFNSRVQIPTSDDVPIEITNGFKVQGKRYLSSIGCSNKWSIAESPVGLYFIDNITNEIYLFNGQITSLSTQLGFSSYVKEHNHLDRWNPITFDNFKTHYDKSNGDVYFTDKTSCLVYSESINQFTSFMSYEETPYMFNIDSSFYAIKNNKIWKQFAGDYNSFYGETKPYSITVISNSDSFYDKIFNTVEFRADTWDNDKLLNSTFDTLEVWNEYQYGKSNLTNILGKPSPLKRKFRLWRANVPRDISNNRDRIRNTWAYVKLEHSNPSNYKTEFHDLMVHYFM